MLTKKNKTRSKNSILVFTFHTYILNQKHIKFENNRTIKLRPLCLVIFLLKLKNLYLETFCWNHVWYTKRKYVIYISSCALAKCFSFSFMLLKQSKKRYLFFQMKWLIKLTILKVEMYHYFVIIFKFFSKFCLKRQNTSNK